MAGDIRETGVPNGVKCQEGEASGVYFVATTAELGRAGQQSLADWPPQTEIICFEAAQEGEDYQQITARLQYALGRAVHGIPVRPASSG